MPTEVVAALISSLLGGLMVAIINLLFTRKKIEAEIKKIEAESRKTNLEAEEIERKRQLEFLDELLERAALRALEKFLSRMQGETIETPSLSVSLSYLQETNKNLLRILTDILPSYIELKESSTSIERPRRKTK